MPSSRTTNSMIAAAPNSGVGVEEVEAAVVVELEPTIWIVCESPERGCITITEPEPGSAVEGDQL